MTAPRTLFVGCPMWAQRAWVGRFLPADTVSGRELHAYSRLLNAVEGNTTFYAAPTPATVARWREQALPGFRFVFKVPKHITHDRRLRGIVTELTAFCQLMEPLGDAGWQPIVAQWLREGRTPTVFLHTPDNARTPALALAFHEALTKVVPDLASLPAPLPLFTHEQSSLF